MPTYCFSCEYCGKYKEEYMDLEDRKSELPCKCGNVMYRDYSSEHRAKTGRVAVDHYSEAVAVHPDDVDQAMANAKAHCSAAAPDCYDGQGRPHWKGDVASVLKRKRDYLKTMGYVDKNSFY